MTTYGMSETCGGCVYDGSPLDGVDVRDRRDGGRVSSAGRSCSPATGCGPTSPRPALVDGRHVTQDLGRWTPDGRLEVLGRADDVIVTGGVNVPAAMVERVAVGTPRRSRACAVVGVPDPEWGERVVAVVAAASGCARRPATVEASCAPSRAERLEPAAFRATGRDARLAAGAGLGQARPGAVRTLLAPTCA